MLTQVLLARERLRAGRARERRRRAVRVAQVPLVRLLVGVRSAARLAQDLLAADQHRLGRLPRLLKFCVCCDHFFLQC